MERIIARIHYINIAVTIYHLLLLFAILMAMVRKKF